jgi:hypothetical protein
MEISCVPALAVPQDPLGEVPGADPQSQSRDKGAYLPHSTPEGLTVQGSESSPLIDSSATDVSPQGPGCRVEQAPIPLHEDNSKFLWDATFNFDGQPAGLSWEDFDLNDLNLSSIGAFPSYDSGVCTHFSQNLQPANRPTSGTTLVQQEQYSPTAAIQKLWFTRLKSENDDAPTTGALPASGRTTPRSGNLQRTDINESYRLNLFSRLRPKLSEEPLPSTEFLVGVQTC